MRKENRTGWLADRVPDIASPRSTLRSIRIGWDGIVFFLILVFPPIVETPWRWNLAAKTRSKQAKSSLEIRKSAFLDF
jgi:hypothetical protein